MSDRPRHGVFALVTALIVYAALEGIAFVADRFVVGDVDLSAVAIADSIDARGGRERAGLGFKDPAMSLHPFLGYVYTPRDPDAEPGIDGTPGCQFGASCCRDGIWRCDTPTGPQCQEGVSCERQCCDPTDVPPCIEGASCCSDGHRGSSGNRISAD